MTIESRCGVTSQPIGETTNILNNTAKQPTPNDVTLCTDNEIVVSEAIQEDVVTIVVDNPPDVVENGAKIPPTEDKTPPKSEAAGNRGDLNAFTVSGIVFGGFHRFFGVGVKLFST